MISFHPNGSMDTFHKNSNVRNVATLLLNSGKLFLKDIALIINSSTSSEDFEEIIDKISQTYIDLFEINEELTITFYNLWGNLRDIYRNAKSPNLRGAILEYYVYLLITQKYENKDIIDIDCNVEIDEWYSERTVDIAVVTHNQNNGECYECKISEYFLEEHDIENLKSIYHKSGYILKPKIVSFAQKSAVTNWIKGISNSFSQIEIYGRDNLLSLSQV